MIIVILSCRKDPVIEAYQAPEPEIPYIPSLPDELYDYEAHIFPSYFTDDPLLNLLNTLDDANQLSNEGATLGRVLFYDKNLDKKNYDEFFSNTKSYWSFSTLYVPQK